MSLKDELQTLKDKQKASFDEFNKAYKGLSKQNSPADYETSGVIKYIEARRKSKQYAREIEMFYEKYPEFKD